MNEGSDNQEETPQEFIASTVIRFQALNDAELERLSKLIESGEPIDPNELKPAKFIIETNKNTVKFLSKVLMDRYDEDEKKRRSS